MSISRVQFKLATFSSVTSGGVTFDSDTTNGNQIVALSTVRCASSPTFSWSDSKSNSYSSIDTDNTNTTSRANVSHKGSISGGSSHQVSCNWTTTIDHGKIAIYEFSGAGAIDVHTIVGNTGATTIDSGSLTPNVNGFWVQMISVGSTYTPTGTGSGWNADGNNSSNYPYTLHRSKASTASSADSATGTVGAAVPWCVSLLSVKPAAVNYTQTQTGTLATSGVIAKLGLKASSGPLASSGVIVKQEGKAVSGALALAAITAIFRLLSKSTAGNLTTQGILSFQLALARSLAGALATGGVLQKTIEKRTSGTLDTLGTFRAYIFPGEGKNGFLLEIEGRDRGAYLQYSSISIDRRVGGRSTLTGNLLQTVELTSYRPNVGDTLVVWNPYRVIEGVSIGVNSTDAITTVDQFVAEDLGAHVRILGAGEEGFDLLSTVGIVNNARSISLTGRAGTAVFNSVMQIGLRRFTGFVWDFTEQRLGDSLAQIYPVSGTDAYAYADRSVVSGSRPEESATDRINWLLSFLPGEITIYAPTVTA